MPLLLKIGEVSLIEIGITYLVEAKSTLRLVPVVDIRMFPMELNNFIHCYIKSIAVFTTRFKH